MAGPVPIEILSLSALIVLSCWGNNLEGFISSGIGNLTSLQELSFHSNQITGPLPSEIGGLFDLKEIWLGNNQITGPIPSEFGDLFNLEQLWLHDNLLTSTIPPEIGSLVHAGSLSVFDISNNGLLFGNLPNDFCDIEELAFDCGTLCGCECMCLNTMPGLINYGTNTSNATGV